jgi:exosortase C (VPDSG-CTERM-specific)
MLETSFADNRSLDSRKRIRSFICLTLLLMAAFSIPLWQLVRYAFQSDLQSHILLAPFISFFLFYISKKASVGEPSPLPSALAAVGGVAALVAYLVWGRSGRINLNDALVLSTFSFYCFLIAIALGTLGWSKLRPHRFALAFPAFIVPLPLAFTNSLSVALQYASAELLDVTLRLTGMPVFRDGLTFQMAGLTIFVAEECSGIRSTLVLFITSLLAAHLFLHSRWKKVVFVLCVFPLGVLRNAFRITSISWLTVNVDSGIIDSPLHHRGGPVFFVLSLIPLFALLWLFRRSDLRKMSERTQREMT